MSWIIVGDRERANFACNTTDQAFGPLHTNYKIGSAKNELRNFAEMLERDPRRISEEELRELYVDWKVEE